jgi:phosphinothricin acetyltransferase
MARRVAAVVDRGLPWLVGECGQQVIGFAYAGPYRLRPGWAYAVEDSIYLDPAACGQGLGTRLLRALLSRLEASGLRRVFAVIGDSANEASRRLHLRCGFREIGVLERAGWKQGRWVDSVLAQRDLGLDVDAPPAGPGWMGAGP